jgi:hypothetical protein
VAGDQQARPLVHRTETGHRHAPEQRAQRVDAGVAGDVDLSRGAFCAEIGRAYFRGCEQQGCLPVNRYPVVLLGPGQGGIEGPEARFDMCDRHPPAITGQRSAEGAGGIALHYQQLGRPIEQRRDRRRDLLSVRLRVGPAGTSEPVVREALEPVRAKVELRVLAGQDQAGPKPAGVQGMEDRGRLDGLGPSADHCKDR